MNFKEEKSGEDRSFKALERILNRTGGLVYRRKGLILISIAIVLISLIGMFKIEVRQDIIAMLKDSTEIDEARAFIDVELGGSCELITLFEGKGENSVIEPQNLKRIERIQHRLITEVPEIRKSISIVDFLKEMNQAVNGDDPDHYTLPTTKELASQLLLLYSFDEDQANLQSLINNDYSQARIRMFSLSADDSIISRAAFDKAERIILEESKGTNLKINRTGRPKIFFNMVDILITAMVKSFSYAFVVIFIMMVIVFRSFKLGLLSMIINIIPAIITFGIMGWLGIPLNLMTAMVPSIAIGIAVDDTIHLIWRIKKEIGIDGNYREAIFRSLRSVGKPIITTSVLISVGFAVFYFSEIVLLTEFAFLTIATVVGALITDLFLGPVLVLIFKPIKIPKGE
ncbi:MAG: efflux RND transporter permease subunit [Spirochaetota bacterium]|nr:efflux RND transporter permease subunit [Spirochaetota bacterium]